MLNFNTEVKPSSTPIISWTPDEAIDFECAKEAIGHMMAICSSLIYQEEKSENPNIERINELNEKRSQLAFERKNVHLKEHDKIAKIRREYGAAIKAYERDGGPCPV